MQTYSKQQARDEIGKLVATFAKNEAALQNKKEAQIEQNYIRPLFRFLNWNTENEGLSPANWEFILQDTDRKGKMPDYRLELDGQHLLLMDAKMVKYNMHDPRWQYQVYGYAYCTQNQPFSRKVDFAVLTDFQEFILLDCTLYAVKPEVVNNFRILDWTCDDYVNQFDTLWELFERENMRAAARTRGTKKPAGLWAQYLSPQKAKANRIPPDKAFLANMDDDKIGWRILLAKDMKKHNPKADSELITAAVQLLIDRLLFIKALSDREIEDDFLADLAEQVAKAGLADQDKGWFTACESIFAKLNRTYNGSIFEPRPELEAVAVSNKVIRDIIRDLQPENSPYNFASMPVEILGTIYERFLGRVVNATDQRVKIEDKPEVRKAGGVYYTPQYIVEYIVQNTVGKLLSDCKNPADVAKLKILDPACGSGSFLIGAYEALILWHEKYYGGKTQIAKRDREAAYYDNDSDGRVRLTAKLKRQILLNNVFGVDIDQQAVEVTRFSLSLKALEDTKRNELYEEVSLFKKTVLPDLRSNIKCGNSLIAADFSKVSSDLERVHAFDWPVQFPDAMKAGGFDAVVGNPPWLMAGYYLAPEMEYLHNAYRAATGKFDLYYCFIEKGISLLSAQGEFGMIVPNKLLHTKAAASLRKLLRDQGGLRKLLDFGDAQLFEGATNYSSILLVSATKRDSFVYQKTAETLKVGEPVQVKFSQLSDSEPWNFAGKDLAVVFKKMSTCSTPLESITWRFGTGTQTGADKIMTLPSEDRKTFETKLLRPILRGRDVKRYVVSEDPKLAIFPYTEVDGEFSLLSERKLKEFPKAYRHLVSNRCKLDSRIWFGQTALQLSGAWFGYVYLDKHEAFKRPHILTPSLSDRANFAIGTGDLFLTGTAGVTSIILDPSLKEDLKYILGLLNSRLLALYAVTHSPPFSGGFFKFSAPYLKKLPIRRIDFKNGADKSRHDRLVELVDKMLALTPKLRVAKGERERETLQNAVTATDQQIDRLVYELYGLTANEIKIVEG